MFFEFVDSFMEVKKVHLNEAEGDRIIIKWYLLLNKLIMVIMFCTNA